MTLDKQDILDIINLIQGASIRFDQAARAVELQTKLQRMLEEAGDPAPQQRTDWNPQAVPLKHTERSNDKPEK